MSALSTGVTKRGRAKLLVWSAIGVIGDGPRSAVVAQLVALGASIGGASRRPLDEPGVEIHDLDRDADGFHALMHLVVRVQPGRHACHRR